MDWKKNFIEFCLRKKVLKFGKFILKSGRTSPYFFNSGLLCTGKEAIQISLFYARSIIQSKIKFDVIFGPSYKGIPIVVATAIALKNYYNLNIPYNFNRKEEKKYGEKGILIGKQIKNKKVIILDDVITSGIAISNSINTIEEQQGKISSIFVLLDRKEKKQKNLNNRNFFKNEKNYKVISIITIDDVIFYLQEKKILKNQLLELMHYREKYRIF